MVDCINPSWTENGFTASTYYDQPATVGGEDSDMISSRRGEALLNCQ